MYTIDLQSRIPIYEQVYKSTLIAIMNGSLKQNDKLPTVREVAKDLGVNPNTIMKAYSLLERDGLIYTLAGRGVFLKEEDNEKVKNYLLKDFISVAKDTLKSGISKEILIEEIKNLKIEGDL